MISYYYSSDEGLNLIKSLLVLKGHKLYSEIWSDQPPVFTYIVSYFINLFGFDEGLLRILINIFSLIIVLGVGEIVSDIISKYHQRDDYKVRLISYLFAFIFVPLINNYLKFSNAIMIGIPCLSFGVLGAVFFQKRKLNKIYYFLSAFFLSLSVFTKFFGILIAFGLAFAEIIESLLSKRFSEVMKELLIFAAICAGISLVVLSILTPELFENFYSNLLSGHLKHSKTSFFSTGDKLIRRLDNIKTILRSTTLLFVVGLFFNRLRLYILPLSLLLFNFIVFANHKPIWEHHYYFIYFPFAILAAVVFSSFALSFNSLEKIKRDKKEMVAFCIFILSLSFLLWKAPGAIKGQYKKLVKNSTKMNPVVVELIKNNSTNEYVFTDMPLYAIAAGKLVPPEIAVLSWKRVSSMGNKKVAKLYMELSEKYPGSLFYFHRYPELKRNIAELLESKYECIDPDNRCRVWREKPKG